MVKPHDESLRARFASELDRNFSVVASAGSGKTTAITERILSIARSPNAAETLPHLVVVTFTNRAADEMQQRTRQALLQEHLRQEVQTAFNRAFFGTIHSFCTKPNSNWQVVRRRGPGHASAFRAGARPHGAGPTRALGCFAGARAVALS